jgi:serine/threonine protein kinase/cytochrome c-type biogenesis protein CcmH/NrfG
VTLSSGTRIGSYEILAPLGVGGMGEVYRARDSRLGREVAVKVLPAEVASSPDRLARFEREARTVAGLNHPNIVVLYTVEDADGVRFLTMELVEGQTLSNLVALGGLPLPKLLELTIPLTDALVAAHEKGVIHRDLKPGNVMVTREGRVKVLDFGLAKMMGADTPVTPGASFTATVESPISGEGHVVGTVPYMSPEQLRGEAVDARSDLFSLGIILYELAAGRRPFTGETSIDVSHAILRDTPEPLSRVRTDLPAEVERLIGQCLEKNPRERVQSALDVNNALRRLRKVLERGETEKPASDKAASIAVLPFANRSASADDEYFSDGLADELLNVLSKIKGLRVTARSSAFTFKGKQVTAAEIGRALNVATLLEGSVRKAGNRIRVSVQLVQVSDSSHLWSETYDRTLEDIFAVQDDIAQSVVKELRTTLLGEAPDSDASGAAKADVARAAKGRGTDPEAHRLYLLARHLMDRWTREDTAKAIGYLKEALGRDPEFGLGWAELGNAYSREANMAWAPVEEGYSRSREAVDRALSLDPDLPEGHAQLGRIQMQYDFDFRGAEASFTRALELAPGDAAVLRRAGALAMALGGLEEAIGLYRRALEQDPLSAGSYYNLGSTLEAMDRFVEGEAAYRKALELAPQSVGTRGYLSLTLLAQGRGEEALKEALREPEESFRLWALAIIHHGLGHAAESDAALEELIEKCSENSAFQIAEVYGARGMVDRAFEWLERAYEQRDGGLAEVKVSPRLRSLHGDPRWSAFLRKMGLED